MEQAGQIVKIEHDQQRVFGWAYVAYDRAGELVVDKSGEFVDDVGELEETAYDFVLKSRLGGADHRRDDNDRPIVKSTMIESVVFTPEKIEAMGLPEGSVPQGWWVGYQIHDKATWNRVKKGELTAFSVYGKGRKTPVRSR